jgi:hypothetical protein
MNRAVILPIVGPIPATTVSTTTPSISRAKTATGEAPDDDAVEELPAAGGLVAFPATEPAGVGVVIGRPLMLRRAGTWGRDDRPQIGPATILVHVEEDEQETHPQHHHGVTHMPPLIALRTPC